MNEFKDMLKYLRKREDISQAELALRLGISSSAIGNYESGTRMPTPEIEEALADYFNVSLDFLRGINHEKHGFSSTEIEIIHDYRSLNDAGKKEIRNHMNYILSQDHYRKDGESSKDSETA